eukprot:846792-Rhodomonas_salina.1
MTRPRTVATALGGARQAVSALSPPFDLLAAGAARHLPQPGVPLGLDSGPECAAEDATAEGDAG